MRDLLRDIPAGEGFERVGWRGLVFMVPVGWNLRLFDGDERAGALFFADLRATRLEARWRGMKGRGMERSLARLRGKQGVTRVRELGGGAVRVAVGEAVFVLAEAGERLYEFHWPGGEAGGGEDCVGRMVADFLEQGRIMGSAAERGERYWSIYGARGWVPMGAKLKRVSLLPGETRLEFGWRGGGMMLGAVSLADRLLGDAGSLRNWGAKMALVAGLAGGRWEEGEEGATYVAERRGWWRRVLQRVELRHDAAANRIGWIHHWGRKSG